MPLHPRSRTVGASGQCHRAHRYLEQRLWSRHDGIGEWLQRGGRGNRTLGRYPQASLLTQVNPTPPHFSFHLHSQDFFNPITKNFTIPTAGGVSYSFIEDTADGGHFETSTFKFTSNREWRRANVPLKVCACGESSMRIVSLTCLATLLCPLLLHQLPTTDASRQPLRGSTALSPATPTAPSPSRPSSQTVSSRSWTRAQQRAFNSMHTASEYHKFPILPCREVADLG